VRINSTELIRVSRVKYEGNEYTFGFGVLRARFFP
jgi:hypothetical protein